ncbi:hypothetical protein VTN77DRAFT_3252 [Rasamsonia byssochlamydoides]|uniref:uncharacterized protein n=1 Tax=Rasamsonia byssochlamydoides TaxID=89139 RepID=UPI003744673F
MSENVKQNVRIELTLLNLTVSRSLRDLPFTFADFPVRKRRVQLPLGTALIIPPQEDDPSLRSPPAKTRKVASRTEEVPEKDKTTNSTGKKHWIVCLFTSRNVGRYASSPEIILENTRRAVEDMKTQLAVLKKELESDVIITTTGDGKKSTAGDDPTRRPGDLWSCRFNSGLFGVKWEKTRRVLEEAGLEVTVVRPPGEE